MTGHVFLNAEDCGRICLVLFHSLWQMGLAAMLAWLLARKWRAGSVEWAYWAHVGALVAGMVAMPVTFMLLADRAPGIPPAAVAVKAPTAPASKEHSTSVAGHEGPVLTLNTSANGQLSLITSTAHATAPVLWKGFAPWFVGFYAFGAAMMFVRLGVGIFRTERMRRRATPITTGAAAQALAKIAEAWRLRGVPLIAQAERIVVPTVIGLLRPMILLPASALTALTADELELILAHELAHVRRFDLWVNLLQRLGEVVLFFNPALWYLSRRISALREYCCDELVCRQSKLAGVRRATYAAALLRVVEAARPSLMGDEQLVSLAASGRSTSELRRRIARLLGEPLREPLRVSRGGVVAVGLLATVLVIGTRWTKANAEVEPGAKDGGKEVNQTSAAYPPPETDADRVVAAARARTFGTEKKAHLMFRLRYWNSDLTSMRKMKEASLKLLFEARGKLVDEEQQRYNTLASTWAWDGDKLFKGEERWTKPAGVGSTSKVWEQARYWDGHEGWQMEGKPPKRNVFRFATLADLFEHGPSAYKFPQIAAAGGRVPWQGPELLMEQQEMSPALTRYKLVGSDKIDDVECDVYEGPARHERVWIDKSRGVIKAVCEYILQGEVPNYYREVVRTIAGRTFVDGGEYAEWVESQSAEMKENLGVFWAVTNFAGAQPGNLSVFSDYREIAPGIRWPARCERTLVLPRGDSSASGYRYFRGELSIDAVEEKFAMKELADVTQPRDGDKVTDERFGVFLEYTWSKEQTPEKIAAQVKKLQAAKEVADAKQKALEDTPINSVADAIKVLGDEPKVYPATGWARAIKYLADRKEEAFVPVVQALDAEKRDYPISKLAFTLRAMGDPRAVPVLIRALPKTLLRGRSDFSIDIEELDLQRFMHLNDIDGKARDSKMCEFGRAFREVVAALQRLTKQKFDDMELNWVYLSESPRQARIQRAQFQRQAQRWANWWEANWQTLTSDPAYAKVELPRLAASNENFPSIDTPPVGKNLKLVGLQSGWIVPAAQDAEGKCFMDLDTLREAGWPASLESAEKIGVDSPQVLAWAQKEGFDLVGTKYTPPGDKEPLYCLKPLGMKVWKISSDELRDLPAAMSGNQKYPLEHPVEMLVPRCDVIKPPYDLKYGGDSFLFVTREGTAGVIRMTAQVTDTDDAGSDAYAAGREFMSVGYYRGAKVSISAIVDTQGPADAAVK